MLHIYKKRFAEKQCVLYSQIGNASGEGGIQQEANKSVYSMLGGHRCQFNRENSNETIQRR